MLKQSEVHRIVNDYIGVSEGYLIGFNYRTHREFYSCYCDIEIDVDDYGAGTTREKFIRILEESRPLIQAKILKGIFKKFPVSSFEKDQERRREIYDEYQIIIERLESFIQGKNGDFKNLIFAANGPKPEFVLVDATTNEIKIVKNEEYCLIYDRPLTEKGLLWEDLVDWWCVREGLHNLSRKKQRFGLLNRLMASIENNEPEKILFHTYYRFFFERLEGRLPALIPQVYLHYDPYTQKQLKDEKRRLPRQRMDFLLLLPYGKNVVIEVDGKQHYSENEKPSPRLYAEMVAEDRRLKLTGYEVYRFGGYEFLKNENPRQIIESFFDELFKLYNVC